VEARTTHHLPDGRPYVLRPIAPEDKPLLRWGIANASAETLHRRFLGPKPRLSAAELRYLTEVDMVDHVALVAVLRDRSDELLGVGRWVRDRARPDQAEVAVLIGDAVQGMGVGTILGLALADAARERGIARLTATMLAGNAPAQALFRRISGHLEAQPDGAYTELVADLAA
jgi:RimJ/RimL family protein N-acetyltransferase